MTRKRYRQDQDHHTRSPFRNNLPDFTKLLEEFKELEQFGKFGKDGKFSIDFYEPEAQRYVTKAILKQYFGIQIDLPENHLCPPVPQRLNYLLWIQDLLVISGELKSPEDPENDRIIGFDIGVGASCIFPLLGAAHFGWKFYGTDIDPKALEYAQNNIEQNKLSDRIKLSLSSGGIFENLSEESYSFSVCNPPFYSSESEAGQNKNRKLEATESELVYPGGEEAFVKRIFKESLEIASKFRWFTSMLGKKSSLKTLQREIFSKAQVVKVQEFSQGRQTRWGIAWTFQEDIRKRIIDDVSNAANSPLV